MPPQPLPPPPGVPSVPCAQVRGRCLASVIKELQKGAEDLLCFTVNIPALNSSPHLKELFQGWGGDTAFQGVQGLAHPATPSDPHTAP